MTNYIKKWLLLGALFLGAFTTGLAQSSENEKLEIPLSQPGKPGLLRVSILHGSIKVSGYNGKQVLVSYGKRGETQRSRRDESDGLRRLPNNNLGLEVREENNNVTVKTSGIAMARAVDIEVQVPSNFSVKLKTLNDGVITVEDLNGELEVDNLNGNIALRNVSG